MGGAADGDPAWHDEHALAKIELPTHANPVLVEDGYQRSAMLFVDEEFVNCPGGRDRGVGALGWRPFVRFDASTLQFDNSTGEPRLVQVGIGVNTELDLKDRPPPAQVARAAGATATVA